MWLFIMGTLCKTEAEQRKKVESFNQHTDFERVNWPADHSDIRIGNRPLSRESAVDSDLFLS